MDTEKDHNINPTNNPQGKESQEKPLQKKVKRQATQAELDHPLHGVKLAYILESLVDFYGWEYLEREVKILCFKHNPTIKVSLKFLRKMTWAKEHVEDLYMEMLEEETYQKLQEKKKADN